MSNENTKGRLPSQLSNSEKELWYSVVDGKELCANVQFSIGENESLVNESYIFFNSDIKRLQSSSNNERRRSLQHAVEAVMEEALVMLNERIRKDYGNKFTIIPPVAWTEYSSNNE